MKDMQNIHLIEDLQTVERLANCRCLTGNRELAVSDEDLQ